MNKDTDFSIDGITLDPENKEFQYALESVLYTHQLIYLTGKAGTGKTTFLKYLRKVANKKMVVLAPTGVAAVNAKGQTIHSFFHIPLSLYVPDDRRLHEGFFDTFRYRSDKIQMIKNMELLVIDEVSMVRCDLLDVVDVILRTIRKKNIPFGGIQVLLIGDTFQLPPVVKSEDQRILHQFYDSEFFFSARVMNQVKPLYIELKKVYRQKEKEFIDVLNRIRVGKQDSSDIQILNSRINTCPSLDEAKDHIVLTTTNDAAGSENRKKLEELPTESCFFEAEIEDNFPANNYPTDEELELKVGTQVMFIKNNWLKGYFNGKIGKVAQFNENSIVVEVTDEHDEVNQIDVEPFTWENINYTWNEKEKRIEEKVTGTFKQYPLKLAWAITVHKSQGMTFEKVIADVGCSFTAGQVYVALSRCTSMNGLILKSRISSRAIKTDPRVIKFSENEVPETLILEELQKGKADYYYAEARKSLKHGNAEDSYDNLIKAIKYRNDIETDLFRRYFCAWVNLYHRQITTLQSERNGFLKAINKSRNEVSKLTKEKESLQETSDKQESTIKELKDEISNVKSKLSKEKETIKAKNKDIRLINNDLAKKESKNKVLESDNSLLKMEIEKLQAEVNGLMKDKSTLEHDIEKLTNELDRIKNIKWYQKLFGRQ